MKFAPGAVELVAMAVFLPVIGGCGEPAVPSVPPSSTGAIVTDLVAEAADALPGRNEAFSPETATALDITFDDLTFDWQKGQTFERTMLSPEIESLVGRPVTLRGYILPSFQQSGITQFVLVRDNQACCFGPGAALYDCVVVEMNPGTSVDYTIRPVAVQGKLSVEELKTAEGTHLAIYHIDSDAVE